MIKNLIKVRASQQHGLTIAENKQRGEGLEPSFFISPTRRIEFDFQFDIHKPMECPNLFAFSLAVSFSPRQSQL
jgi:hypothetical protein